jgi:hypothetical protein
MKAKSTIPFCIGLGAALGLAVGMAGPANAQQQPSGSYQRSCRNLDVSGGFLTAECRDIRGGWQVSSIPYARCRGDIGNNNGVLQCNGATASLGAQGGRDDRSYRADAYPPSYDQDRRGGAQPYPDRPDDQRSYGQGGYGDDDSFHGDYGRGGGVYPEFADLEQHIRDEIRDCVRDDLIERDDARDLFHQLRDIQDQERREFQVHGWRLPYDDRMRIGAELRRLDHLVDQIRDEP